jgi:small subunit ribosomal protein S4
VVDRPSYRLRPGQVVQVRESSRSKPPFQLAAAGAHADGPTAPYLSVSAPELTATVLREPARAEIPVICDEQLVVEYYSR